MSEVKTGGAAFPSGESYRDSAGNLCGKSPLNQGMTLRDYFAAKAMEGLISGSHKNGEVYYEEEIIAESAYKMADAMLAEREKQQ